ncbi:lycopene beta-cyclase CrtY [Sphingobium bisphenolivorans]|uniref:lycopene beta-cyclase CrtY n=1 Tax=Sphingobium bisphenolivorans TaxID=1335760 RepID=UPI00039DAA8A|nr:lycopene beta-cyclase CrtY [Sphingobium bisphenolivorans]
MHHDLDCDLAIVGGGLAGSLTALAFAKRRPDVRLLLLERDEAFGGNHLWSFFDDDIRPEERWLIEPLVTRRWAKGHEVRFPGHRRVLDTPYNSIASPRLDARVRTVLGASALPHAGVRSLAPTGVELTDGRSIRAKAVIDARGPRDLSPLRCGWQKFVGHRLRLDNPHGLERPIIMDASVEQIDGYRFVYVLPWDANSVFVEDTYYSDDPQLDVGALDKRITAYAAGQGWQVEEIVHREQGVLPVVYGGDFERFWPKNDPVARAGVGAGLFHPMTGYSLPDAVATALWLTSQPLEGLAEASRARAAAHWQAGGYYRLLGKMLFGAAKPEQRWRIFERFYRLSPDLIGRFYAGRSTWADRIRILCGKPPVPITGAMRALLNQSVQ